MTHHNSDEHLAEALSQLPNEKAPPAALEDATVLQLRRAGLVGRRGTQRRAGFNLSTWALAAGIAAVAFVGGSVFANRGAVADAQPTFALLLYGADTGEDSATRVARAAEYSAWANVERADARIVGGEALGRSVAAIAAVRNVARGSDSVVIADDSSGPNDFVGYFLVSARDREAAVRLASNHPHLKYGGRVIVRRINPTNGALATLETRP